MEIHVVTHQVFENHILITINNGKANAISFEVIDEINTCLTIAETQHKVVILTGTNSIFSGGYDLSIMKKSPEDAKKLVTKGSQLSLRMLSFPMPIIIACNGHAIAKGAFLLLSADYRIGIEGDFKIGLNEVLIGMTMHHAGIVIAKSKLSPVYLNRSVINAELYNPQKAIDAGFLDMLVPNQEQLLPTATKIAQLFSQLNKKAHATTKLRVRASILKELEEAIQKDLTSEIAINS